MQNIPLKYRIKVVLNVDGYEAWGIVSMKKKTPLSLKTHTKASEEEVKQGKFFYPPHYFGYCMKDNKPTLFIEKENNYQRYFEPANIVLHKTKTRWTGNDEPKMMCTLYTNSYGRAFETERYYPIRLGECFHVDKTHRFKTERIPDDELVIFKN